MENKQLVEFKCYILKERYSSDNYKIYVVDVDKNIYPNVKSNNKGEYILVGNLPNLIPTLEYNIQAYININSKFGLQYSVKSVRQDKATDINASKNFLNTILSEDKTEALLNKYPNIIDKIIKNDLEDLDLSDVKGIKEATFSKIKEKVIKNYAVIEIVDLFNGLISMSVIQKLYEKYTSASIVKKQIIKNPYKCLCSLSRIGFKSADGILLELDGESKNNKDCKFHFDEELLTSKQRMKACINYILEENESSGNTKMTIQKLRKESAKLTPECIDKFVEVIKDNDKDIYVNNESKCISSNKAYETEKYISEKINELLDSRNVWNINTELYRESKDGFTATDEQLETLNMMCHENVGILTASAGCVDCDTEFFNGTEWKKISEYKDGDKVLQYNHEGYSELVNPISYIKLPCDNLWETKTMYGVNMCLSDEHRVVYETDKHNLKIREFSEIKSMHEKSSAGFSGKIYTTFKYNGKGIDLSEFEIRLMCAIIADGSFKTKLKDKSLCRINIKKQIKKDRLEWILNNLGCEYRKEQWNPKNPEYNTYVVKAPRIEKEFTSYWYNCSDEQMKIICDEVLYWDSSITENRKRFSTTIKQTADFVQFAYATQGKRVAITINDRRGQTYKSSNSNPNGYIRKSIEYCLAITDRNKVSIGGFHKGDPNKTKIKEYKTKDGYKYCFKVPSTMLVLRRGDRIFITGNCGKTASAKSFLDMLDDNNKSYILMTPTGKSSEVLSEQTERVAGTIHRQLKYKPTGEEGKNPWGYNEQNKLPYDVIVIDEFSMTDIYLFKHVLDAIDTAKTKLLLIFDPYQLASVGCGNLAQDFLDSNIIPVTRLTKIFRYGEGGLMQVVTKIRNGEQFLPSDFTGVKIFGEKKDFVYVELQQQKIVNQVLKIYKKMLNDGYDVEDIIVLACQNKGDLGTKEINKKIQYFMQKDKNNRFIMSGDNKFYKDDKVMQVVNNYKAETPTGEETDVFNGNTGVIVDVSWNDLIVDFGNGKLIQYSKNELTQLDLGYCISTHRSQGSSIKQVICVAPKSHTFMLNSNLLYVAGTRARERVYMIGNIVTINKAIKKKENLNRDTWMVDLLEEIIA